jgi:cell division protein FtsL
MINKRRDSFLTNLLSSKKFFAFIGFCIIIFISIPLVKQISKKYYVNNEIKELQGQINELDSKNKNLKQFISYLDSDEFVEEQARLNMGLKKEGEQVVVIKDSKSIVATSTESDEEVAGNNSNINKWKKYFFGI